MRRPWKESGTEEVECQREESGRGERGQGSSHSPEDRKCPSTGPPDPPGPTHPQTKMTAEEAEDEEEVVSSPRLGEGTHTGLLSAWQIQGDADSTTAWGSRVQLRSELAPALKVPCGPESCGLLT